MSAIIRKRLDKQQAVLGTFQIINSSVVAEAAGLAGLDFVILDQEHGPLTANTSLPLCQAVENGNASPVIRVRSNSHAEIQRALDIGAAGVTVPHITCRADAEKAVDAARFTPEGGRGLCPYTRAGNYHGGESFAATQNTQTLVIAQIEGEDGVANLDEILEVDGIDILFLGPYDLSQSLGMPGKIEDDSVVKMMNEVCIQVNNSDKVVGTYAETPEMAQRWMEVGVQFIAISMDSYMVYETYSDLVSSVGI